MEYKPSKYNHWIQYNGNDYLFNAIYESYFEVPSSRKGLYTDIVNKPEEYRKKYGKFLEKLAQSGFILSSSINEIELVKQKYFNKRKEDEYFIMILPTYQCNLRCWYCIQNHADSWMSEDVISMVKKRIELKTSNPSIKVLRLSWFGGEPTLNYRVLIDILSFAKERAKNNGQEFVSDITTNGTLLTSERIKELRDLGVASYQITIDGTRDTHNKVKSIVGKSAFDITLRNIKEIINHTFCTLRINYTMETLMNAEKIIKDIDSVLNDGNRRNLRVMLCKVWQEENENINLDDLLSIMNQFKKKGYYVTHSIADMCYAEQFGFECILPDGSVGFCDNDDYSLMPGHLNSKGEVEWKKDKFLYDSTLFTENQEDCNNCTLLPICWGPCAKRRAAMWNKYGKIRCSKTEDEKVLIVFRKLQRLVEDNFYNEVKID